MQFLLLRPIPLGQLNIIYEQGQDHKLAPPVIPPANPAFSFHYVAAVTALAICEMGVKEKMDLTAA
jgi:hypothetical protein